MNVSSACRKVLLISSPFEGDSFITASLERRSGVKTAEDSHYPLGLVSLHAMLESRGHQVRTLFLNGRSSEQAYAEIRQAVEDFRPDIAGLQVLTPNRTSSSQILDFLRHEHPGILLLAGGIHATIMHRQMLMRHPGLVVALGEGELTLAELAGLAAWTPQELRNVPGIAFETGGEVVVTAPRPLVEELDSLPFPKHDLFMAGGRDTACILTARGCPFSCSFCSLDSISRRKVRLRSIPSTMEEIELLVRAYPALTTIWIHDDTFFIDNERVIAFCDEIIRRGIRLKFVCSGRVKPISRRMVEKLEQANFVKVLLGLESADEGILRAARKNITRQDVLDAFSLFAGTRIELYAFLIVGLPGETEQTVWQTAQFVQRLQRIKYIHYKADIAILAVYPGTEIYRLAQAHGLLDENCWLSPEPTPIYTVEHDFPTLLRFKDILLDHIALERLGTLRGLRYQARMLPHILRHLVDSGELWRMLLSPVAALLRRLLPPSAYRALKNVYLTLSGRAPRPGR